jgi:preprotein translocase subunit SecA
MPRGQLRDVGDPRRRAGSGEGGDGELAEDRIPIVSPDGSGHVRNPIGWRHRLARLRGTSVDRDLTGYAAPLAEMARLGTTLESESELALETRVRTHRQQALDGTSRDVLRLPVFALIREIARRSLGMRPFDVQVVAALALDRGAVVDMRTGEGKTLTAVMPAALTALAGRGAHVLTFNDYLARRDAEWMGPIYRALGLSVAFIDQTTPRDARRRAYRADVTYVTAKEAGFDYLRDLLARRPDDFVHRPFHFALVDEADSLMIDEARTPLVIAGAVGLRRSTVHRLADLVSTFTSGVDYDTDEYGRDVELTEAGIEHAERALGCGNLHDEANYTLLTELNCALHAHALLKRDVDYIVRGRRIELVDELTGRVVHDRHWPDGLQSALEAKEGLEAGVDGQILGTITLQHFLGGYERLCGMTGTAEDAAAELDAFYGRPVVVVPTNRPEVRIDRPDVVFTHREAKEKAVVAEVERVHASGRPVLVGTLSVEESERLAARLRTAGVECDVLNAKNDEAEAAVVARAGALGAVTISTNMAGRGTDICLGAGDEPDHDRIAALGGLYVIGTNRHESRRVDDQLRGRAGRQGDPGESRFFVSLEDDLLVKYGIRSLIPDRFVPEKGDEPIDHPVVLREIARAQRIVEGQNLEIRKTLSRYSAVVDDQRRLLMARRQALLDGRDAPEVWQEDPARRERLVGRMGEDAVDRAERAVTIAAIDRQWVEHLATVADLREGVHLVTLGGLDPLTHYTTEAVRSFQRVEAAVADEVRAGLERMVAATGTFDPGHADLKGPSATWTYLVNDDPFRNQIGMRLTGPGRTTVAVYSAALLGPLLVAWGLVDRFLRKRSNT